MLKNVEILSLSAVPTDPQRLDSGWMTAPDSVIPAIRKLLGNSQYKAIAGTCTWLNGVYWLKLVSSRDNLLVVENLYDVGKKKVDSVTQAVESGLVYPLIRGRDVHRWRATPSAHILYPHTAESGWQALSEADMKKKFPKGFGYLNHFKEHLLNRAGYSLMRKGHPFYILANTSPEILAPHKVVFKELSTLFQAAFIGTVDGKPVVPDTKLRAIAVSSAEEGHFLCAILNSSPVVLALYITAQWVQTPDYQATDIQRLRIPKFDPKSKIHRELAELSAEAHEWARKDSSSKLTAIADRIDRHVSTLREISPADTLSMRNALKMLIGGTTPDDSDDDG